jgi:hypothetical protein
VAFDIADDRCAYALFPDRERTTRSLPRLGFVRHHTQLDGGFAQCTVCWTVTTLFTNGQIVDLILALVVVEATILLIYRSATGRGVPAVGLLINLLAGAFLLMALRGAMLNAPWIWTAAWLAAALIAHVADLAQRWQR